MELKDWADSDEAADTEPPTRLPTYPADHRPAVRVPKGGSSCSNCFFLLERGADCGSPHYKQFYGTTALPAPADEFCSDWWEQA